MAGSAHADVARRPGRDRPHLPGLPSSSVTGELVSYRIRIFGRCSVGASKALLLSTCAFFGASTAVLAQDAGTTVLEGITIYSANRTPTDAAKVGSSVEVLTEKDLEKQSRTYLKDYLEQLPGVNFAQNGPPGTQTRISIRGAGAEYIKVLIDGIDVSDPSNTKTAAYFQHLLVGDIARIEVLKGSQSMLYGGDAVGGVISIDTKAASKPGFSQSGGAEGGQYNTFNGAYTAGYLAANGSNISLTVQGVDTDGFSSASAGTEDDGYTNLTFSGRGEYYLSPTAKVFFAARTLDADGDYDSFAAVPPFLPADGILNSTTVQHAGRVGTVFSLFDGAFENTFAIQGTKIERDEFNNGVHGSWFDGDRIKGEYKGVLRFNDRLSLLAGADWEETGMENVLVSRATADVSGAYAQLMAEPIDGLVLTGGARMDEHSAFGRFDTYRLTAAYLVPGTETKFRATRGTGFRTPSLDELYGVYDFGLGPFDYGNEDLKPEESTSWDAGIEQGFWNGRMKLAATYFEVDTDNLIRFDLNCGFGAPVCNFNEIGTTKRNGVELSAATIVTDGFTVTAGYTYTDTETPNDERLTYVPRHNFVIGFEAQPIDKVNLNVTVKYVADTLHSNGPPVIELDDYVLVNAKASYEFMDGWKAYVRGENLLDEDYETIRGYGTAGVSVYGGVTMALPSD